MNSNSFRRSRFFAVLITVLLAVGTLTTRAEEKSTPAAAAPSPWERIVMIGASVSSGWVKSEPFGGTNTEMHKLSRYMEAALLAPHEPIKNLGSPFLFLQPEAVGPKQVEEALKEKPTLLVALDFMFWFCYGAGKTDEERMQRFEHGLKMLEKFDCPMVVGDLPDASAAVNVILRPDQMPSQAALTAANKRLKEWIASRKQAAIVPLSEFMKNGVADHAITVGSYTVPEGKTRVMLQRDKLHPSPPGCAMIALSIFESFQATRPGASPKDFRHDGKEIFHLVADAARTAKSEPATPAAN